MGQPSARPEPKAHTASVLLQVKDERKELSFLAPVVAAEYNHALISHVEAAALESVPAWRCSKLSDLSPC